MPILSTTSASVRGDVALPSTENGLVDNFHSDVSVRSNDVSNEGIKTESPPISKRTADIKRTFKKKNTSDTFKKLCQYSLELTDSVKSGTPPTKEELDNNRNEFIKLVSANSLESWLNTTKQESEKKYPIKFYVSEKKTMKKRAAYVTNKILLQIQALEEELSMPPCGKRNTAAAAINTGFNMTGKIENLYNAIGVQFHSVPALEYDINEMKEKINKNKGKDLPLESIKEKNIILENKIKESQDIIDQLKHEQTKKTIEQFLKQFNQEKINYLTKILEHKKKAPMRPPTFKDEAKAQLYMQPNSKTGRIETPTTTPKDEGYYSDDQNYIIRSNTINSRSSVASSGYQSDLSRSSSINSSNRNSVYSNSASYSINPDSIELTRKESPVETKALSLKSEPCTETTKNRISNIDVYHKKCMETSSGKEARNQIDNYQKALVELAKDSALSLEEKNAAYQTLLPMTVKYNLLMNNIGTKSSKKTLSTREIHKELFNEIDTLVEFLKLRSTHKVDALQSQVSTNFATRNMRNDAEREFFLRDCLGMEPESTEVIAVEINKISTKAKKTKEELAILEAELKPTINSLNKERTKQLEQLNSITISLCNLEEKLMANATHEELGTIHKEKQTLQQQELLITKEFESAKLEKLVSLHETKKLQKKREITIKMLENKIKSINSDHPITYRDFLEKHCALAIEKLEERVISSFKSIIVSNKKLLTSKHFRRELKYKILDQRTKDTNLTQCEKILNILCDTNANSTKNNKAKIALASYTDISLRTGDLKSQRVRADIMATLNRITTTKSSPDNCEKTVKISENESATVVTSSIKSNLIPNGETQNHSKSKREEEYDTVKVVTENDSLYSFIMNDSNDNENIIPNIPNHGTVDDSTLLAPSKKTTIIPLKPAAEEAIHRPKKKQKTSKPIFRHSINDFLESKGKDEKVSELIKLFSNKDS
ncbi:hypothetical protein [uncultured Endozoicomonas sp.]|uniref:hypothetical protein n=1 Tax=uncultured Endozoicomonas sp. TaxID=432652 RepID=UPI00262BDF11|nr:hypothetical protein [uncultured Endozoicomonas sp.]